MRFLLVTLLAGLCAVSISVEPSNYSQQQKDVWRLFKHINQPSYYKDHVEIANNFNLHDHISSYSKPQVVEQFHHYWKQGKILRHGEIFSVFHHEHLEQAIALFKLFYHANDYNTLYKTAAWARNHVSEGMFVYSFSVALIHRPDTYYFSLPPIYEIYPHYFYRAEVIYKAQHYKQMYCGRDSHYNNKVVHGNYSGYYLNLYPEQAMSYFTEDVGVNAFYYYYNLYYPFWMSGEEYHLKEDRRGEVFYFMYQQILARYYLERLSHGFGEIGHLDWEVPFQTGYHSCMVYPNGLHFPDRPHHAHLHEYFYNYGQKYGNNRYAYSYSYVQDHDRRIHDVIDSGYVLTHSGQKVDLFSHEGINMLGNLIEGNPESPYYKYYGAYQVFARHLLGYSHQPLNYHQIHPSVLEHFETSMRDPAFYQLYKKLVTYFTKYKAQHHHHYSEQDLVYHGVHIKNVEVSPLVTYFDHFEADLTNAVYVTPEEFIHDTFKVRVAQERLNHQPFSYKIHVDSNKDVDVVVKVFLGPKYDEYGRHINLTESWMNFVQFDHFVYQLHDGENVIERNSREIYNYMHDRSSYYEMHQKAMGVHDENQHFQFHHDQFWFGFPQRFMLPMGSQDGTAYQFYVMIVKSLPYKSHFSVPVVGSGAQYVDAYPMGYPFDRPVHDEHVFHEIPNSCFHEVHIYHHGHGPHGDVNHTHESHHHPEGDYTHHEDYDFGHTQHIRHEVHDDGSHTHDAHHMHQDVEEVKLTYDAHDSY